MISAVLDTNVVISGIFWPDSLGRRCLAALARRYYSTAVSREVFHEYESVSAHLHSQFPGANRMGTLSWLRLKSRWVEPFPLGKQRSRDIKDDPLLACALSATAKFIVTWDEDLLVLQKPFGIEMITPNDFLFWLRRSHTQ